MIFHDSLAMDGFPVSRAYLETLTSAELTKWADHYGVDIPPGLDRIFIIEELLEIAAFDTDVEEEFNEVPPAKFTEPVVLPRQYNITFIETLVRDPLWVFIFWEVKGAEREVLENSADFTGYFLKVSPWGRIAPDEVFTVPLAPEDSARYLGFPPAAGNGEIGEALNRSYRVELYAGMGKEENFLAATNPFNLPALSPRIEKQECLLANKYPLIRLSGIEEFLILRSGDRESRKYRSIII